ncbi:uncharacterized protein Tco025E_05082 [Trypanosoma conorhini]|uniref:Rubicon Homology domain-containing protein n=1 Tax=Trypanosoma conorhini TaxID=83891 RepID=A0A3S5IT72_9TRYP|nr:uncharacterized protein Tco025E_05082 [Trypanosoma conorhini]RNF16927.1 hypothetical protein Tco025E_05082 [Trypanosoma conorhini]
MAGAEVETCPPRELPNAAASASWVEGGLGAVGADAGEAEDGDDVAALLGRARSCLEEARRAGPATAAAVSRAGGRGARGRPRQAGEERWRRLRYLEWLTRFVLRQQRVSDALRQRASEAWQLAPAPAAADGETFNGASGSAGSDVGAREAAGSDNSRFAPVTPASPAANGDEGRRDEAALHVGGPQTRMPSSGVRAFEEHAHHAEENTVVAVASACDDVRVVVRAASDRLESAQEPDSREEQSEWRRFRTWFPSELSCLANVPQPHGTEASPVPHILCLSTIVHEKPRGMSAKNEALLAQGRYCKSCLCPLKKSYFPVPSWKAANFCYYTGMYYCKKCHSGRKSVIPARVLHFWDVKCFPVCNDAIGFLELQLKRPLYCVSAVNPRLYDRVALLEELRCIRMQLVALREVGVQCSVFRRLFYLKDGTNRPTTGSCSWTSFSLVSDYMEDEFEVECFVPREKRYLMEDSEVWSLDDLLEVHRCCPGGANCDVASCDVPPQLRACGHARPETGCRLFMYLRRLRLQMTNHIFQRRCDTCLRNSLDICRWCCPSGALEAFGRYRKQGVVLPQRGVEGSPTFFAATSPPPLGQASCAGAHAEPCLYMVHSFDLLHVRSCPQCGACYHRRCFEQMQCELAGGMGCLCCRESSDLVAAANASQHLLPAQKKQPQPE